MLRFLTDELQAAEDAGERGMAQLQVGQGMILNLLCKAWIIGHVLSGWDGSNPMLNPTDLFYQMCVRATLNSQRAYSRLVIIVSTALLLTLLRVSCLIIPIKYILNRN